MRKGGVRGAAHTEDDGSEIDGTYHTLSVPFSKLRGLHSACDGVGKRLEADGCGLGRGTQGTADEGKGGEESQES
jgi:hypothetical protein